MPKNKRESLTARLKEDIAFSARDLYKGESDQWARTNDWLVGSPGAYDFALGASRRDGRSFGEAGYSTDGALLSLLSPSSWGLTVLLAVGVVVLGYAWFQR
jgi:hypothetical protein